MDQSATPPPGLVVPVRLSALVVNADVVHRYNFQRWQVNFHRLNLHLNPEPEPFDDIKPFGIDPGTKEVIQKDLGVYLQWELPDALRRGTHDEATGRTVFPVVPNRWLIVRRGNATSSDTGVKMWVVESDHMGRATGTSPFLWTGPDNIRRITRIGRTREVTAGMPWAEPEPPAEQWKPAPGTFLTAVGAGIPAFSHYQPYNENVFSFHDHLTGHENTKASFTYLVAGWYSDPRNDRLAPAATEDDFTRILSELNWEPDQALPRGPAREGAAATSSCRSYYAGLSHKVSLDPEQLFRHTPVVNSRMAIGNSSLDALVALVKTAFEENKQDQVLGASPELLEALQYGMLDKIDQPDGMLDLDRQIHKHWFTRAPGGYLWQIADTPPAAGKPAPQTNAAQRAALAALNAAQDTYDTAVRSLHGLQRRLYDAWWLHSLPLLPRDLDRQALKRELDPEAPESLARQVRDKQLELGAPVSADGHATAYAAPTSLAHRIIEAVTKLTGPEGLGLVLATDTSPAPAGALVLKRVPAAPFHSAQDPVVLIRGAGLHEPMDTTTALRCRPVLATPPPPSGDPHADTLGTALAHLPEPVRALAHESARFDPDTTPPPQHTELLPDAAVTPWAQPWQPLYLEWEATYRPIPFTGTDNQPNWTFDGDRYQWTTPQKDAELPPDALTLTGRCMLSAHTAFNMGARLRQHAHAEPDADKRQRLEAFADSTARWDLLAQTLSGFTTQLTAHDQSRNVRPDGELGTLTGPAWRSAPDPGPLPHPFEPYPASGFQEIRAGQFAFTLLKIVDRFGRAHVLVEQGEAASYAPQTADDTTPATGEDRITELPTKPVHLRPRLIQGARLRFDLVDAHNDSVLVDHDPAANPVCGWLLSHHLDQALACYHPDGTALGELRTITATDGTRQVTWYAVPGSPAPDLNALSHPELSLSHLQGFLTTLHTAGPAALAAALDAIDETLTTIHPRSAHSDTTPAVLAGRPLALIRTRLALELDTPPLTDPHWEHVLDRRPPQFLNYPWPVRLGERDRLGDGLLAYHDPAEPGRLYTVHPATDPSGCLKPIDTTTYPHLQARHRDQSAGTADHARYLTLLVDPSAQVHATTGILPPTSLAIPARFTQQPLNALELFLRVGPLLTTTRATASDTSAPHTLLAMPRPSLRTGTWTWSERDRSGADTELTVTPADTRPHLPADTPVARVGLLKLTPTTVEDANTT
ncbi:hypothetical protein [Streptomyces sp. CBMA152]|uniref:hypothetical protein n=1 Tax=Streptomyces sp. CBMA152 TaxID=1896312 RepID=UPI001660A58E|nr:hypothetical protein [Streptomyces sp. CBMA152]MBD0743018.1 hypothetical protein [Streptomyces sp. CBMA152]